MVCGVGGGWGGACALWPRSGASTRTGRHPTPTYPSPPHPHPPTTQPLAPCSALAMNDYYLQYAPTVEEAVPLVEMMMELAATPAPLGEPPLSCRFSPPPPAPPAAAAAGVT